MTYRLRTDSIFWMRFIAGALAVTSGCKAADPSAPFVKQEKIDVRANESVLATASRMAERLEPQLSKEVGGSEAVVFARDQIGMDGEGLLVGAISLARGAFAIIPLNRIQRGIQKIPVCRFRYDWPSADAPRSAAGLTWALRQMPSEECRTLPSDDLRWEKASSFVQRQIALKRGSAAIVTVAENAKADFPTNFRTVNFPPDLRAAMRAVLSPGERLVRIAPLPSMVEMRAFGWTSKGRTLLALPDRNTSNVCVVEAPLWADFAKRRSEVVQMLDQSCQPLFAEINEAKSKRFGTSPGQPNIMVQSPK